MSYTDIECPYLDTRGNAWYTVKLPIKSCSLQELANYKMTDENFKLIQEEASKLIDLEQVKSNKNSNNWYTSQFEQRGTISDRIALAVTKLTENNFMFYLSKFNFLFEMAEHNAHHFTQALNAITAIWKTILPPRPLKKFANNFFATLPDEAENRSKVLFFWYVEDKVKTIYRQFLNIIEVKLKDRLLPRREAWLDTLGTLLLTVIEQRQLKISLVINKLGDPTSTIAHKSYHLLIGLIAETSTCQTSILSEIEKVIFQSNCSVCLQKYAVSVMNQLVYSREDRKLAVRSVQSFLILFKQLAITQRIDSKITDAIIVGLRRAFPFAGSDLSVLNPHIDALFILTHTGHSFQQRLSVLSLLYQFVSKNGGQKLEDRYYRSLYHLLLISPKQLPNSGQLTSFFSALYKAIRSDRNQFRVVAFIHRLLQRCLFSNEAFICASLLLIAEIANTQYSVRRLIHRDSAESIDMSTKVDTKQTNVYTPSARDPQFSNAQKESLWILSFLSCHSHPAVAKLVYHILNSDDLSFDVHPLDDMTLSNFLEIFVDGATQSTINNKSKNSKGISVFKRTIHTPNIIRLSDPHLLEANPENLDVSILFLHRFAYQRKQMFERHKIKNKRKCGIESNKDISTVNHLEKENLPNAKLTKPNHFSSTRVTTKHDRQDNKSNLNQVISGNSDDSYSKIQEISNKFDLDFDVTGRESDVDWKDNNHSTSDEEEYTKRATKLNPKLKRYKFAK